VSFHRHTCKACGVSFVCPFACSTDPALLGQADELGIVVDSFCDECTDKGKAKTDPAPPESGESLKGGA
jgi:hypothetical protein